MSTDVPAGEPKLIAALDELPPLVDLDETLSRTDLLWEGLLILAKTGRLAFLGAPFWLMRGKAGFNQALAQRVHVNPELLIYHSAFLEKCPGAAVCARHRRPGAPRQRHGPHTSVFSTACF